MRKTHRWRTAIYIGLFALGLLLLLSALVETPAEGARAVNNVPTVADAMFMPAVPPANETAAAARGNVAAYVSLAFWALASLGAPCLVAGSDANGRVLRKKSYVRSYYPVFRQELACG